MLYSLSAHICLNQIVCPNTEIQKTHRHRDTNTIHTNTHTETHTRTHTQTSTHTRTPNEPRGFTNYLRN